MESRNGGCQKLEEMGDGRNGKGLVKGYKLSVIGWIHFENLSYSVVTKVNYTVLYTWNLLRQQQSLSPPPKERRKKKKECEPVNVLINLIVEIISQCIHTSNHQIVHITYIAILFVSFISIKLERNKRNQVTFRMQIQQCLKN